VVIGDFFLRKLPPNGGDELADVLVSRYEKSATMITSQLLRGAHRIIIVMRRILLCTDESVRSAEQ
jgi:hypothetical protein